MNFRKCVCCFQCFDYSQPFYDSQSTDRIMKNMSVLNVSMIMNLFVMIPIVEIKS